MHELTDIPVDQGGVKSARRALVVLELMSRKGHGLTFSELLTELGYPKGSLHALLRTLTDAQWVRFSPRDKRFVLGFRVWEAGNAYARMVPWTARAHEVMARVRDRLGETVQLAVLDNFEALYVAKVDGAHLLKLDSSVGQRLQPHATGVGKMLLSALSERSLAEWLAGRVLERYTQFTIVDPARLAAELAAIRERGYSTDLEERTLGASCVAVGIRNARGELVAAMSVSAPSVRFDASKQAAALDELRGAAEDLSVAIGADLPAVAALVDRPRTGEGPGGSEDK
jgi:DNA-binding IclR family transcriptional regulator